MKDLQGIDANSVYFADRPFGWGVGSPRTFFATGATRVIVDTSLTVNKNMIGNFLNVQMFDSSVYVKMGLLWHLVIIYAIYSQLSISRSYGDYFLQVQITRSAN